jgi:hypothetical protein
MAQKLRKSTFREDLWAQFVGSSRRPVVSVETYDSFLETVNVAWGVFNNSDMLMAERLLTSFISTFVELGEAQPRPPWWRLIA